MERLDVAFKTGAAAVGAVIIDARSIKVVVPVKE